MGSNSQRWMPSISFAAAIIGVALVVASLVAPPVREWQIPLKIGLLVAFLVVLATRGRGSAADE